jgi:putative hydrolase of the HAD superfamily
MISYLLFDLDNTLYPASCGLDREIGRRMTAFVSEYLGISLKEARALRNSDAIRFGTTLQWLRQEYGFHDIEGYFDAVHPEDVNSFIEYDPGLVAMLESIPLPKGILTNSPMEHARRVMDRLEIERFFPNVFDIRFNKYRGKPYKEVYQKVLAAVGKEIDEVLFIDDLPHYIAAFRELGGRGLLVDETGAHGNTDLPSIRRISELEAFLSEKLS